MPTPGKSTMFSNGSEAMMFFETYCWRCYRYKEDEDNIPARNSCRIEKAMSLTGFDNTCPWPDEIIQTETLWHHCPLFVDRHDYQPKEKQIKPMKNQIAFERIEKPKEEV